MFNLIVAMAIIAFLVIDDVMEYEREKESK